MRRRARGGSLGEDASGRHMAAFAGRKKLLLKKAMELSVLCDCDVALIVFGPDGKLVQYSSEEDMDRLLEEYAQACQKPHERYTNSDLLKAYYEETGRPDDTSALALARKRQVELDASVLPQSVAAVELPVGTTGQAIHVEGIKPAGFMDDRNYPVSPRSDKAYNDISAQLERWVEQLNNRGSQEFNGGGKDAPSTGPLSPGGKRFKSLSVIVPENAAQPILRRASAAGDAPAAQQPASSAGDGPSTSHDTHGLLMRQHSASISGGGLMGLSLPSPSNLLFGFPSAMGSLFTSRGGLNLDLPMPDSTSSLGRGPLEWPTSARDRMLPGFSDDNESGEELAGDLMVTGRGIKHIQASPAGEKQQEVSSAQSRHGDNGMEGLVVSGIKVSMPGSATKDMDFEFPGFASQKEPTVTPMQGKSSSQNNGIDLPLDM